MRRLSSSLFAGCSVLLLMGMCPPNELAVQLQHARNEESHANAHSMRRSDGTLVPWIAAEGKYAFRPETSPVDASELDYSKIFPRVFAPRQGEEFYLGATFGGDDYVLQEFLHRAREGEIKPAAVRYGVRDAETFRAPIAVYEMTSGPSAEKKYVLVQGGSYQVGNVEDQPYLKEGYLVIYRGIGSNPSAGRFTLPPKGNAAQRMAMKEYFDHLYMLFSDSEKLMQSAHNRGLRAETDHMRYPARDLLSPFESASKIQEAMEQQYFSLEKRIAAGKFGPRYMVLKVPIDNVKLTSFFAAESEVTLLDPRRVKFLTVEGNTTERKMPLLKGAH